MATTKKTAARRGRRKGTGTRPQNPKLTPQKRARFLEEYAKCGIATTAAKAANVSRDSIYNWRAKNPEFAKQMDEALDQAADVLEQEAHRRAYSGTDEPVYYQGEVCGYIRKYSDTLLIFLLKGARPEKFKDRQATELTGKGGGPVEVEKMSDTELASLVAGILNDSQAK